MSKKKAKSTSSSGGRQGKVPKIVDLTSSTDKGFKYPSTINGREGGRPTLERVESPIRGFLEQTSSVVAQKQMLSKQQQQPQHQIS